MLAGGTSRLPQVQPNSEQVGHAVDPLTLSESASAMGQGGWRACGGEGCGAQGVWGQGGAPDRRLLLLGWLSRVGPRSLLSGSLS